MSVNKQIHTNCLMFVAYWPPGSGLGTVVLSKHFSTRVFKAVSWAGTEGLLVSSLICDQSLLLNNNYQRLYDNRLFILYIWCGRITYYILWTKDCISELCRLFVKARLYFRFWLVTLRLHV